MHPPFVFVLLLLLVFEGKGSVLGMAKKRKAKVQEEKAMEEKAKVQEEKAKVQKGKVQEEKAQNGKVQDEKAQEEKAEKEEAEQGEGDGEEDSRVRFRGSPIQLAEAILPQAVNRSFIRFAEGRDMKIERDKLNLELLDNLHALQPNLSFPKGLMKEALEIIWNKKFELWKMKEAESEDWINTIGVRIRNMCRVAQQGCVKKLQPKWVLELPWIARERKAAAAAAGTGTAKVDKAQEEKVGKEKAQKEKVEKEKAQKEKVENEKAQKEKAENEEAQEEIKVQNEINIQNYFFGWDDEHMRAWRTHEDAKNSKQITKELALPTKPTPGANPMDPVKAKWADGMEKFMPECTEGQLTKTRSTKGTKTEGLAQQDIPELGWVATHKVTKHKIHLQLKTCRVELLLLKEQGKQICQVILHKFGPPDSKTAIALGAVVLRKVGEKFANDEVQRNGLNELRDSVMKAMGFGPGMKKRPATATESTESSKAQKVEKAQKEIKVQSEKEQKKKVQEEKAQKEIKVQSEKEQKKKVQEDNAQREKVQEEKVQEKAQKGKVQDENAQEVEASDEGEGSEGEESSENCEESWGSTLKASEEGEASEAEASEADLKEDSVPTSMWEKAQMEQKAQKEQNPQEQEAQKPLRSRI
jgi:hypothetical protein